MKNYILENSDTMQTEFKEYKLFDKAVYVLKPLPAEVSLDNVLQKIDSKIPPHLTDNFENIYIGEFPEFSKNGKHFNAMYKDGTIYVSNQQDNDDDMVDDIVHEIAHAVEKQDHQEIYGDQSLENEFLGKRKFLHHIIPLDKRANMVYFLNPGYDESFDMYLYRDVGYETLRSLASDLFYSPYAITALKEYWANGFENYLLGDRKMLRELSPILYNKIEAIIENSEEIKGD